MILTCLTIVPRMNLRTTKLNRRLNVNKSLNYTTLLTNFILEVQTPKLCLGLSQCFYKIAGQKKRSKKRGKKHGWDNVCI